MLSPAHQSALEKLAKREGWEDMSLDDLGVLLWCLFHYYVGRLKR